MRIVQTTFIDYQRIEQRLMEGEPGLSSTGDGRLIIGRRHPYPTDWVNGIFVGDHDEPEEPVSDYVVHVHGEPS